MRTQTTTALSDGREWVARPVDPTGWLAAAKGTGAHGASTAEELPGRRADDRGAGRGGDRAGRRSARLRRQRRMQATALSRRAVVTHQESPSRQDPAAGPVRPDRSPIESAEQGYRLGRWARLALTVTALMAAVVVATTLVAGPAPRAMVDVTVAPGDTLWSIARAAAPDRDPRAVIEEIEQLNDLPGQVLPVGVVLRVPVDAQ